MHSFPAPSGIVYLHNGDFSGSILIPDEEIQQFALQKAYGGLHIPFEDIRAIYLEYLRRSKISALEQASTDFLEEAARKGI